MVDQRGVLLGCIQHDDAVDVHEEEVNKEMMQMAGVDTAEPELVYTQRKLKIAAARIPWLMATLAGLSISALMYRQFQLTFPNLLTLIPFIPVISAMGGNMGTQTSMIIVRGFAIGRVNFHNLGRVFVRELFIGLLIGVVCGAVAGGVALLWHGDYAISYTVTVAMVASIMAAASIGVLLPYLFRWFKIDPAVAAGPLVTTLEDIVGVVVYYLCAVLIIS